MKPFVLKYLCCPACQSDLKESSDHSVLFCQRHPSEHIFPIVNDVPRFVRSENYASSFGLQWNVFHSTQFDSRNNTSIFNQRFQNITGLKPEDFRSKVVIDCGCGPGAFTDLVAPYAQAVIGVDLSQAIDAYRNNFLERDNVQGLQASLFELPLKAGIADLVICIGVLQHTPNPVRAFAALLPLVRFGGSVAIWNYKWSPLHRLTPRFLLREIFKRMNRERAFRWLSIYTPIALKYRRLVRKLPVVGRYAEKLIFVCDYQGKFPLDERQLEEWALMDTYDALATRYETRLPNRKYIAAALAAGAYSYNERSDQGWPALVFTASTKQGL